MEETQLSLSIILKRIKEDFNLTNAVLAAALLCDEATISRYLANKVKMSEDKAILLKEYVSKVLEKDIYNDYIFKFEDDGYYFHGSRQGIMGEIRHDYSDRKHIDFSTGFYLGESFKQSSTFIAEENNGKDRIYRFIFDKEGLTSLELSGLNWVFFIAYNRKKIPDTPENQSLIRKMRRIVNSDYDYFVGDIADDRMSRNMELFFDDALTFGQLQKCLTQLRVGKQYCLRTEKAVKRLKYTGIYILDDGLRYLIKEYASEKRDDAIDASNKISSTTDNDGLKFSSLLQKYGK